jgi:hypothetical protein
MTTLSSKELARMKDTVEAAFNDTCLVFAMIGTTQDTHGQLKATFAAGVTTPCTFQVGKEVTAVRGQLVTTDCDAVIVIGKGTIISNGYEVEKDSKRFTVHGVYSGRLTKFATLKNIV